MTRTAVSAGQDGRAGEDDRVRCGYCRGGIPAGEAVDVNGESIPADADFVWVEGGPAVYHRECVPEGEGPWVPWTANGVLAGE